MKAFKEWISKQKQTSIKRHNSWNAVSESSERRLLQLKSRQEGWKAALEWFRDRLKHCAVDDALYFLDEELER